MQCEYVKWSPEVEVRSIQHMDIGIMPLSDTLWNRGKCAYKILLYMGCGLPVVASPVGMNSEVLAMTECGFAASGIDEWVYSVDLLISDETKRRTLGKNGRALVSRRFSVDAVVPELAKELLALGGAPEPRAVECC